MQTKAELVVHGLNAVLSAIKVRPEQVIRLFFTVETAPRFGKICKSLAAQHKVYRQVEAAELEKICRSSHHGGAVAVMSRPPPRLVSPGILPVFSSAAPVIIALDSVANVHNIGAISRTAAFLGVVTMVADNTSAVAAHSPAAWRVAEGGLEYVTIFAAPTLADWLQSVRDQARIIGADQRAGPRLSTLLDEHYRQPKPVVIVVGNEEVGLSPDVRAVCTNVVAINGSGLIESLNVAQAAAIFMHAFLMKPNR